MQWSAYLSQQVWAARGPLACLLWPLTLLSRAWLLIESMAYEKGWRRARYLPVPVLVVGNLLAGGTGKTPIVIGLVEHFQSLGLQVGVIARAYGTGEEPLMEVVNNSPPSQAGDEPLLIRLRCAVPVFTGRQRAKAAQALLQAYPHTQLIISDDGLQHRALHHDVAVCVFDDRGLGNGWLLPAGPLREAWPRAAATGTSQYLLHTGDRAFGHSLAAKRSLSHTARNGKGEQRHLSSWQGQAVQALAAIARPALFFAALEQAGLRLTQTHVFPDHASLADWQTAGNEPLLCTEKDAVKLWPHQPDAWAVPLLCELPPELLLQLSTEVQRLSLIYGQKTT
ncbi:MAG: tetraacyldisaccharide 4'-kinase [Limnohabitans sp.]|nr:tetraacyldisaccharide 4'-kinase [Limnohabitans sp.]